MGLDFIDIGTQIKERRDRGEFTYRYGKPIHSSHTWWDCGIGGSFDLNTIVFKYDDLIKCKTLRDYTELAAVAIIQAKIAGVEDE